MGGALVAFGLAAAITIHSPAGLIFSALAFAAGFWVGLLASIQRADFRGPIVIHGGSLEFLASDGRAFRTVSLDDGRPQPFLDQATVMVPSRLALRWPVKNSAMAAHVRALSTRD